MPIVSDEHLLAFGRIIHRYAAVESGIKIALSGLLEIGLDLAMITFEPYGALHLKNVARSLAKQRLRPELSKQFVCIVGDWYALNYLRNIIAHSRWTEGSRPNSIKPRSIRIQNGHAQWFGDDEAEDDYTAEELNAKSDKLNEVNERLKVFLQDSGLGRIVAEMIDATSE